MAGALGTKSPSMPVDDKGMSRPQNTAVGSSCRPGGGVKVPIPTSAPEDPYTLGRVSPPDYLK